MELHQIDHKISDLLIELNTIVNNLEFEELATFNLKNANQVIPWETLNYKGIYFFEVKTDETNDNFKNWFRSFEKLWNDNKFIKKKTPKIIQSRVSKHSGFKEWIPLYIGKSRKVGNRIDAHLNKEMDKSTYALKLLARNNLKNYTFRVKAMKIDVNNYDTILPEIESTLRNRFYPIIGKQ